MYVSHCVYVIRVLCFFLHFRSITCVCLQGWKSTATFTWPCASGPMTTRKSSYLASSKKRGKKSIQSCSKWPGITHGFVRLLPSSQHSEFQLPADEPDDERWEQQGHLHHHPLHASHCTVRQVLPRTHEHDRPHRWKNQTLFKVRPLGC